MIDDPDNPDEPQRQLSPVGLYSHAADVAQRFPQMRGTPAQFKAMLTKQGVKPDEFKYSNYDAAFAGRPMVTKDELAQHFQKSVPPVQETTLSDDLGKAAYAGRRDRPSGATPPTKFSQYTLPGGTNYRETLLHLPPDREAYAKKLAGPAWDHMTPAQQQEFASKPIKGGADFGTYKSSHWDTPNVLAHLRMSDRALPGGQKALHLEELQSDWAQEGRKKGFKQPVSQAEIEEGARLLGDMGPNTTPEEQARYQDIARRAHGVPSAPYVDSTQKWVDLGLKRLLHEAAKGGYHKIVMTPGEEQAKRYDLSKQVRELKIFKRHGGDGYNVNGAFASGEPIIHHAADENALENTIGKDLTKRALEQMETKKYAHLHGDDLKIGGEGMKAFYDQMLPKALEKLAKKHDPEAKVGRSTIGGTEKRPAPLSRQNARTIADGLLAGHVDVDEINRDLGVNVTVPRTPQEATRTAIALQKQTERMPRHEVHSLDITPKMRASILKGQPAYASGGAVKPKAPSFHDVKQLGDTYGYNSPHFTKAYEAYLARGDEP